MEIDVRLVPERMAHRLGDNELIIYEQDHGSVFAGQGGLTSRSWVLDAHCRAYALGQSRRRQ
jgi:hypothetical protein